MSHTVRDRHPQFQNDVVVENIHIAFRGYKFWVVCWVLEPVVVREVWQLCGAQRGSSVQKSCGPSLKAAQRKPDEKMNAKRGLLT